MSAPQSPTPDDMAAIFTGPVEGRDYDEMPTAMPTEPVDMYDTGTARLDEPQSPERCPDWCIAVHPKEAEPKLRSHVSRGFAVYPDGSSNVCTITQTWSAWKGLSPVQIMLELNKSDGMILLDATQARGLVATIRAYHPRSKLAAALREAADELDRITGSAT